MGFALGEGPDRKGAGQERAGEGEGGSRAVSSGHAYWHVRATPPILELYLGTVPRKEKQLDFCFKRKWDRDLSF